MIIVQGSLIRISCFLMYKAFKFTFIMMVTLPCPSVVGNGRAENNSTLLQFEVSDIKSERMRSMEINKTASKTIPESHRYYKTSDMISCSHIFLPIEPSRTRPPRSLGRPPVGRHCSLEELPFPPQRQGVVRSQTTANPDCSFLKLVPDAAGRRVAKN